MNNNINNNNINEKTRSARGLRELSLQVKEIVAEKGQTSYKEVAETLVQDFKANMKDNLSEAEIVIFKKLLFIYLNI